MKTLADFTGLYQVSKTLRFELIPVGETLRHIEEKGIIEADTKLAESYQLMKGTIDEFHKDFIDSALTGVKLHGLAEYYALYTATGEEKQDKKYTDRIEKAKETLRKEIVKSFKANDLFKKLDKKELIQDELQKWIDTAHPGLYNDPTFRNFTTYFTGYNENRMNMYSDEGKATAVAFRLIDENLPKFIDNIRSFEKIKASEVAEDFPTLFQNMEPWLNVNTLDELFTLKAYDLFLTQAGIDAYNTIIGGRKEGDVKFKGLNEYINLYNQTHPDAKLPKLKILYKQILSDRTSASWLPEAFADAAELLKTVQDSYESYTKEKIFDSLQQVLEELPEFDWSHIYICESFLTDVSQKMFGNYMVFHNALGIDTEDEDRRKKKQKAFSIAELQNALDDYYARVDSDIRPQAYTKSCFAEYFAEGTADVLEKLQAAYSEVETLLSTKHDHTYCLTQSDKEKLKTFLDNMMALLHFVKPLYLKADAELAKDELFYGAFAPVYEELQKVTKLYDKVRNFVTQKPYSTEKVKLNFGCSTLLNGWDVNKETQNLGVLLLKDGKYYLGIMNKADNKAFSDLPSCEEADCYQKVMYKLLPGPNKMLPKVFFSKSRIDEFAPNEEVLSIYEAGSFKKGENFSLSDCRRLIDFFKESIAKHPEWSQFGFSFSPTEQYQDISEFYREISEQGYKITYESVSASYIGSLVRSGNLYLFQIYNKDFSSYAKGKPNLHTLYWKALFAEENLADVVYKLNGEAEVFYRKSSITEADRIVHPANCPLESKNPARKGGTSTFAYDIIKNRRYTVDKFQFHVPITMNFKADGSPRINEKVCAYLRNNPDVNIIGIDRGERHLLYISMINRSGHVVRGKDGKYIQYSLNTITGEYKGADGKPVSFETPYCELLDKKEEERREARENWGVIENIKELKAGYLSQVVHHIAKLMVEYNAIVVLEDLNGGFKNSRKKVEKQVYQNFEKALIEKLNYLVFKDADADAPGSVYHALQLTDKFESFKKLTKQTGFLFYVPAWNTSKIDPVTGFVDYLKPKYTSMSEAKKFFSKFNSIIYNAEKNWFEFDFDYSDFTEKAEGTRTAWTLCTHGELRYAFNRSLNKGRGGYEKCNVTEKLKALFTENSIDYRRGDLRSVITAQNSAAFFASLMKCLQITLAMRYSSTEDKKDFILSPVADKNGVFYCSEGREDGLPQDADANGAFNIARKGLMVLEQIDTAEKYTDRTTRISNRDWIYFVQTHGV